MHLRALGLAAKFKVRLELSVIYALLLREVENLSINKLLELKFSKQEAKTILSLLALEIIANDIEDLIIRLKEVWLDDKSYVLYFVYVSLQASDESVIYDLYRELSKRQAPQFPVDGDVLLSLGYSGKELGDVLNFMKKAWIKSNFTLDRGQLVNLVKK
jgi:hypothetical protein